MYQNTSDAVLNGIIKNPDAKPETALNAVLELQLRIDNDSINPKMLQRAIETIREAHERLSVIEPTCHEYVNVDDLPNLPEEEH